MIDIAHSSAIVCVIEAVLFRGHINFFHVTSYCLRRNVIDSV